MDVGLRIASMIPEAFPLQILHQWAIISFYNVLFWKDPILTLVTLPFEVHTNHIGTCLLCLAGFR